MSINKTYQFLLDCSKEVIDIFDMYWQVEEDNKNSSQLKL